MTEEKKITTEKKLSDNIDVVVLKRCSYFGKGGLVVLEKGNQKIPIEYAQSLFDKRVARKPDGFVKK